MDLAAFACKLFKYTCSNGTILPAFMQNILPRYISQLALVQTWKSWYTCTWRPACILRYIYAVFVIHMYGMDNYFSTNHTVLISLYFDRNAMHEWTCLCIGVREQFRLGGRSVARILYLLLARKSSGLPVYYMIFFLARILLFDKFSGGFSPPPPPAPASYVYVPLSLFF